jgi:molybdopterin biosynthesis enzyme
MVDGYAVVSSDGVGTVRRTAPWLCWRRWLRWPSMSTRRVASCAVQFPVIGDSNAGSRPDAHALRPGVVAYVTTGGPMPPGADAAVKAGTRDAIVLECSPCVIPRGRAGVCVCRWRTRWVFVTTRGVK